VGSQVAAIIITWFLPACFLPFLRKSQQQLNIEIWGNELNNRISRFKAKVPALTGFLYGSALLIIFSMIQKILIGINPLAPNSYVVPFLFGGISGSLLSIKSATVNELNQALLIRVNELEEYLPICSHCKKIREEGKDPADCDSWRSIEDYISDKTSSRFSHSICPECLHKQYPEFSTGKYLRSELNK